MDGRQDKVKEAAFFDRYASSESDYDVFTDHSTERLLDACLRLAAFPPGSRIADLGCGSGTFSARLARKGFSAVGLDLSTALTRRARRRYPELDLVQGDVETLPFADRSLDGALLSGVVHHLPDPSRFAREVHRVLKPNAVFVAFDPNRLNPFMYLYRDRSSPLYSSEGVTENERPVLARDVRGVFERAGFDVAFEYLSGLRYRYVASPAARIILPLYNLVDTLLSRLGPLRPFHAFLLTKGRKQGAS